MTGYSVQVRCLVCGGAGWSNMARPLWLCTPCLVRYAEQIRALAASRRAV